MRFDLVTLNLVLAIAETRSITRGAEREHLALSALLEAMPEPVLSLDTRSKIERANPASCQLFGMNQERMRSHNVTQLISGFNFQRWLESDSVESLAEHVVIQGQNFLLEAFFLLLDVFHLLRL